MKNELYAWLDVDVPLTYNGQLNGRTVPATTMCLIGKMYDTCVELIDPVYGVCIVVDYDDCTPLEDEDAASIIGYNAR